MPEGTGDPDGRQAVSCGPRVALYRDRRRGRKVRFRGETGSRGVRPSRNADFPERTWKPSSPDQRPQIAEESCDSRAFAGALGGVACCGASLRTHRVVPFFLDWTLRPARILRPRRNTLTHLTKVSFRVMHYCVWFVPPSLSFNSNRRRLRRCVPCRRHRLRRVERHRRVRCRNGVSRANRSSEQLRASQAIHSASVRFHRQARQTSLGTIVRTSCLLW